MKLLFLLMSSLVAAAPAGRYPLHRRQVATLCDQYGYWGADGYEVNNNNWGKDSATSGSQCTTVDSASKNGVAWHTTWTWEGNPGSVKSYAYSGRYVNRGHTIASISSMSTSVSWDYDTSDIRANVAYDVFTAKDPNHPNSGGDYELMIWLGRYSNADPIGSNTGTVNVAGRDWDLHVGTNGAMQVYSFVASGTLNSFSADVKDFFNHLESNENYPASIQNLIAFQVGTEAFTGGPATFTVSDFSATITY